MSEISAQTVEHIRGWLSTGFLAFLSLIAARFVVPVTNFVIKRNEQKIQERREEREGYGPILDRLEKEIARISADLIRCQERHEEDAKKIALMEAQILGMNRSIIARSQSEAVLLNDTGRDVAERTARAVENFPMPTTDMEPQ